MSAHAWPSAIILRNVRRKSDSDREFDRWRAGQLFLKPAIIQL